MYVGAGILRALPTLGHQARRQSHTVDICQPSSVLPEEQIWWWHGVCPVALIANTVMFMRLSFPIGKCSIRFPALGPSGTHFAPAIIRSVHCEFQNPSGEVPFETSLNCFLFLAINTSKVLDSACPQQKL